MSDSANKPEKPGSTSYFSTANPWQTLSTELKYENPWIKVSESAVINPSGRPGIYGVVNFKNTAIGIVPVDSERNTYLVGQFRYTLNEYSWEIPEGGGPAGEPPLETAKRELKEETGFTAENWSLVSKIHTSNSVTDEVGYIFLATELTAGQTEFEETEDLALRKVPLAEAVEMTLRGEITDCISVAGILAVARLFNI